MPTDGTHDPKLRSWVESANTDDTEFPIQNLPLGVFETGGDARLGIAIGDRVLDLRAARDAGFLKGLDSSGTSGIGAALGARSLNPLLALGRPALRSLRVRVQQVLRADTVEGGRAKGDGSLTLAQSDVTMRLPAEVGDYSDFYASIDHATNVGAMFRPDNPLLPNYRHVPIGYHGRASSLVVSGTAVTRPRGQLVSALDGPPRFAPSERLDYELEVGALVAGENALGTPVPIASAADRIAGLVLVNDWSARDIQTWEYQPLGPFLSKSFATTLSPWVVTLDALAPFRVPARARGDGEPKPLPYLTDSADQSRGGFDITLEVWIRTAAMRAAGADPERLSRGTFAGMYWTMAQLLAHHASNGCNLRPGDLLASGTISGPERSQRGCLLEIARRGQEPFALASGETRSFLQDGDEVILRGWAERAGARRIGFGECRGTVLPARV